MKPQKNKTLSLFKQESNMQNALTMLYKAHGYEELSIPVHQAVNEPNLESNITPVRFIDSEVGIIELQNDPTQTVINLIKALDQDQVYKLFYKAKTFGYINNKIQEMTQVGVESIGSDGPSSDAEILVLAIKSLLSFSNNILVELSDVRFYESLMTLCHGNPEVKAIVKTKNRVRLKNTDAISEDLKKLIETYISLNGFAKEVLPKLEGLRKAPLIEGNPLIASAIEDMIERLALIEAYKLSDKVRIDLTMKPEYSYYNGMIFKGYIASFPEPVCSGGRYNQRKNIKCPAIGFAIKLNDLMNTTEELNMFKSNSIAIYENAISQKSIEVAEYYRERGYNVNVSGYNSEKEAIGQALAGAIEKVLFIGDATAKWINLRTDMIEKCPVDDLMDDAILENKIQGIH